MTDPAGSNEHGNASSIPISADRFREMVESAGEVIFTTDVNGYFDYVNPAVQGILGYQPEEVVGRHFGQFVIPEWRESVVKFYVDQLSGQELRSVTEFPLASRDGGERWVELTVNLRWSGGQVIGFLGFLRDISDRKAAEEALAVERNLLRTVIDLIPDNIFVKDTDYRFILANTALAGVNGKSAPEEMIGLDDYQLLEKSMADRFYEDEHAVLESGQPLINREEPFVTYDNREIWYLTTKVPLRNRRGKIIGLVGVSRNITERRAYERVLKEAHDELEARVLERTAELVRANADLQQQIAERRRAEQALQNERNLLRTLIDHLPDLIYVKDLQSRFVLGNRAVATMMGASSPEALVGRYDFDFYPPEVAAQFYGDERQLILTGQPMIDREERNRDISSGEPRWLLTTKVPLLDADGHVIGLVGVGRDITARKQDEDRLREQQDFLRQLIDNNPGLIFVKDFDGRFKLINKSVADLYGTTVEAAIGKTDADFGVDAETAQRFVDDDREVITTLTPKFISEERVYNTQTKEWRWVQTNKIPLMLADGYHVLGISSDITERRNAEKQSLELAVERERVRLLANFIRDASHDFRTPLSTINTSLYLLARTPVSDKQRQHLDVIQQQTGHLGKLLEGMLKMTRLDSEHFFRFSAVDVNNLLETIHYRDADAAGRKNIAFGLLLDERKVVVKADISELERALSELVRNAIQFTPDGQSIRLSTAIVGDEVMVSVEDTGLGIDSADQAHVFERFFRADKARSGDTGGVGLGLSIAQKIVEMHGGRMTLESEPGKGSVFRVYLPVSDEGAAPF